ncbi:MAG: hypothetical protein RL685_6601 [Pseudomonadota bacterium]|jgi:hypothetical protein
MRDLVRALVALLTLPSTGVFGTVLLANGTASAADPNARFNTAHPGPRAAQRKVGSGKSAARGNPTARGPAAVQGDTIAQDPPQAPADSVCFEQHELGQELRQAGKLLESRVALGRCARAECPAVVQTDCQLWSSEVEELLPSVLFRVTVAGEPRSDARVVIDGQWRREAPAQAVKLDPGLHELRVSAPTASPLQRKLELRAGTREQLDLNLPALPEESSPVATWSWVLGGVGLAGTAGFVAFGLSSRSLEQDLDQRCAPLCSEEEIDRVRHRSVIANVSLGLGVTSLAAAGALYLLRSSAKDERPALTVGVSPVRRGALCNLQLRAF